GLQSEIPLKASTTQFVCDNSTKNKIFRKDNDRTEGTQ
ncbi:MAG: hypothetical protein ACI90V_008336, partial [Bacillariaceae sp.]